MYAFFLWIKYVSSWLGGQDFGLEGLLSHKVLDLKSLRWYQLICGQSIQSFALTLNKISTNIERWDKSPTINWDARKLAQQVIIKKRVKFVSCDIYII